MILSLAVIIICGFTFSGIMQKLNLPPLLGMMLAGIILGPHVLNTIDRSILNISSELRQIALIVILLRAGLSLDINDLKKVGRPAIMMCFVPATFELVATTVLAPILLGISHIEAAIMGAVLAAVSPAVVVPRMLKLMETGYGTSKSIPQLIMAGASADDIYVIVLFTSFLGMYQGKGFDVTGLFKIPILIVLGLIIGVLCGILLVWIFKKLHMRDTIKVMLILAVAFILVTLEDYMPMSGLLAVMALGGAINKKYNVLVKRISVKYNKIWVGAELMLFVLVGAAVDVGYIKLAGIPVVILILLALVFRMAAVFICVSGTKLSFKERLFCAISYIPKATVQAAIGSIPLCLGLPAGNIILTAAVVAIIITAPLGAIGIDATYNKLLTPVWREE